MMRKDLESNANWLARKEGRVPSKGALAAERASAGLGATDHDAELMAELLPLRALRAKRVVHTSTQPHRP
jgi:hypothetical protein